MRSGLARQVYQRLPLAIRERAIKERTRKKFEGFSNPSHARYGLTRALVANMVTGCSTGWTRHLDIVGTGYNAKVQGKKLVLNIGFCHPVEFDIPDGVDVVTPAPVRIEITGADKQVIGQLAANIRRVRPPEPYKGKGIKYEDEIIRRKAGKSFVGGE